MHAAMKKETPLAQEVASVIQKVQQAERTSNIYTEEQKTALEEARSCIERLVTEYNKVQEDRDVTQQEAFASTEFYEEGLRRDKEYMRELELKLEEKEEYIISIQREWQEKLKEQTATLTKEKAEVVNQLHVLQDELQSLHRFRTCQIEIEEELKRRKGQLIEQQEKEKNNLVELERKYMEQSNHLKRDYEKSLSEIHAQLEKEIEEHVGTKIMHILQDNERLQEELRMHVEVTNGLQKEKSTLQLEAAKLARDVDLLRQAEALHLQRSSTQARCISGNSNKLQKLEKSLSQVIRQYSAERTEIEEEHKKRTAALQAEKQTLKRLAQSKIHELRKVRQLAQQVLKERGEVESFLIESLHYVMEHIQTSKKHLRKAPLNSMSSRATAQVTRTALPTSTMSTTNSHRLTAASRGASPSSPLIRCKTSPQLLPTRKMSSQEVPVSKNNVENMPVNIMQSLKQVPVRILGGPKVDISHLTWEDREKVLRHLFQKIHSSQSQTIQPPAGDAAYPSHHSGYDLLYGSLTSDDDVLSVS